MEKRVDINETEPQAYKAMYALVGYLGTTQLSKTHMELMKIRASQINGCAFCLDMHTKEARAKGETEQRLYGLSAWREAPYYTDRERAALAWAEAVTAAHVPDEIYNKVKDYFSEIELIDLTLAVTAINTWNRVNLAFPSVAGTYKVGMFE